MPFYKVSTTIEYEAVIEADNELDAEKKFDSSDLNQHYVGIFSQETELVCGECEDSGELDLDGSCFSCREDN
jgi:hypothetical protein